MIAQMADIVVEPNRQRGITLVLILPEHVRLLEESAYLL
jgi:hypothetical protein